MKTNYSRCILLLITVLTLSSWTLPAQTPQRWTSAEIHQGIKKLNFLGSALYVAAHPDDENTRMIAYLANEVKANTAYLSMTRGDGGQNLIGPEIRELLGVIRTQELLAARRTDGGNQFFTRANDFGYSKHPDETFNIWNKEEVLADVVWTIRKWQPDIIINRFDHRTPGRTHGHHTGSAMLSVEAFDLAGDPEAFPEQLQYLDTWQPTRQYFNTSWWFYGSRERFAEADKTNLASVDVGVYYPFKGKSNTEIAAESRSMHKCQGFGSAGSRGSEQEYVEFIQGERAPDKNSLFSGINTTWSRVPGGAPIGDMVTAMEEEFDYDDPSAILPELLAVYNRINDLEDGYWKRVKLAETKELIAACMGLFLEAKAENASATPGETLELELEMINRSPVAATLKRFHIQPLGFDSTLQMPLKNNQSNRLFKTVRFPEDMAYTNPYWLNEPAELGMYTVKDQLLRGLPETPRAFRVAFELDIDGTDLRFEREVIYKETDPVAGEVYQPFEITPPVFVNIAEPVYIFTGDAAQEINLRLKSGRADVAGQVSLELPQGWRSEPASIDFGLELKGAEQTVSFKLFPPADASEGQVLPKVKLSDGKVYDRSIVSIAYDHIPTQTILQKAASRIVKLDLEKRGERIGYIMGAGDAIPQSLEQIGYQVDLLADEDITPENLKQYDAVITGIRAYNTNERIKFHQEKLLNYVADGGTMIVQYNTTRRLKMPSAEIGPYPLQLSRDRVAVEKAEVRILQPDHPVLNFPNKITQADFENWVQERGLYFPDEWDSAYTAILSSNDPGEDPKDGGLLVAEHGDGYFIYTGYSWFRELPAGVPGAFRLFANLISIGEAPRP